MKQLISQKQVQIYFQEKMIEIVEETYDQILGVFGSQLSVRNKSHRQDIISENGIIENYFD